MTKGQNSLSKKSILMRILIALCVFAFVLSATLIVVNNTRADKKIDLEPEYFVGQTFEIPVSTVTVGNDEVNATSVMYYPSGKATTLKKIVFDESGVYTLEYRANVGGKIYTEKYDITVNQKAYDGGLYASAVYSEEDDALLASFGLGGVLKLNKKYNLSQLTSKDNLIKVSPVPETKGEMECNAIVFTFTDAYDSTNTLKVKIIASDTASHARAICTAYTQVMIGSGVYTGFDGNVVHKGNNYGRPIRCSFSGVSLYDKFPNECTSTEDAAQIHYDYEGGIISADSAVNNSYGGTLVEIANKQHFANTWKGFATGEVYVSIAIENFTNASDSAKFLIKEIAGEGFDAETSITDTIAPEINVDFGEYTEKTVPNAVKNQAYKVFEATAKDNIDFHPEIKVTAYKNYFAPSIRKSFRVEDGVFTPDSAGAYVLEYKATDVYDNVSTKLVSLNVVEQPANIEINVDSIEDALQGYEFTIPTATASGDSAFGNVTIDTKLYFGETEISYEDGKYIPLISGEYKVVYTAVDYAGTKEVVEKPFNVALNEGSIYLDDISGLMPKYLINGTTYSLPTLYAYVFSAQGYEKVESSIKVVDKRGEVQLTGYDYVPQIENDGDIVSITYNLNELSKTYEIEGVVAMDNEYNVDMTKYFRADQSVEISANVDEVKLNFKENGAVVDFANLVSANDLSLVFSIDKAKNNYSKIVYTLSDSANPNKQVKINFTKASDNYIGLSVNDGKVEDVDGSFVNGKKVVFDIVDTTNIKMNRSGNSTTAIMMSIDTFTDGSEFTGFTNDLAYLSISVENITGDAALNIFTINGNYFNNATSDPAKPKVKLLGKIIYEQEKGSTITIPTAKGVDIIEGALPVTVSVRFNGQYLRDVDGTLMKGADASVEHKITFADFGEYTIIYESLDTFENKGSITRKVKVFDDIAPVIVLDGKIKETAKVGKIEIPTAKATDNLPGVFPVYVTVYNPDGTRQFVANNEFTAKTVGKYKVRYYAYDEAGNLGMVDYIINVK